MGPDGITREFKLSERALFENLTPEQMAARVGLDGKERTDHVTRGLLMTERACLKVLKIACAGALASLFPSVDTMAAQSQVRDACRAN